MKKLITKEYLILTLLAVVFFFLYSWLYLIDSNIFQSPDEMANFHFAVEFAQNSDLSIQNQVEDHTYIHPRSVNVSAQGEYVPVGFIGMPVIYGFIAKVFGQWSLAVLPSVIALLGALSFYAILARMFTKREALLAFILLLILPPWWYYATRGLLPNVSFISFLLIGGNLLTFSSNTSKSVIYRLLGALSVGLAFMIRPIEFIWVGITLLVALLMSEGKTALLKQYWLSVVAFSTAILLYIYINAVTYGDPLLTGYDALDQGEGVSLVTRLLQILFPFGLLPVDSFSRFIVYSISLMLPFIVLAILGIYSKQKSSVHKKYTVVFLVLSLYLILYYGAWGIEDHPDLSRVSIGISYMRYWLPIYVFSIPAVVWGIEFLSSKKKQYSIVLKVTAFATCLIWSGFVVLLQTDDSIPALVESNQQAVLIQDQVLKRTSKEAVIVSQRNDKLFWPKRETIHFQNNNYDYLGQLASVENLFWYTELPLDHIYDIEERFLAPNNMAIGDILSLQQDSSIRLIELKAK